MLLTSSEGRCGGMDITQCPSVHKWLFQLNTNTAASESPRMKVVCSKVLDIRAPVPQLLSLMGAKCPTKST